jgi:hypothetical protein
MQEVFRRGFSRYARSRHLPKHVHVAARAIQQCRTAALGGHVSACPEGHVRHVHYNSCRHRACPQCARPRVDRWLDARRAQLLPCAHFHVVFTTPHELEPLWACDRQRMVDLLFRAVRDTLLELLGDARYLGARPGILATLHTWGRTLSFHPHIHCLVTGGGHAEDGWRSVRNGYLLPVRVVRALFRGKLLAALRDALATNTLRLPADRSRAWVENLLRRLARRPWNVRLQERYAHGRGVLIYLGRYLRGGPIGNHRLAFVDDERVVFRYTDHRDRRAKSMALPLEHFVQRVSWHVPEPRRHVVRYFGLYARGEAAAREACRREIGSPAPDAPPMPTATPTAVTTREARCSVCGRTLIVLEVWRRGREPPGVR